MDLQEKIKRTGTMLGSEFRSRTRPEGPQSLNETLADEDRIVSPANTTTATRLQ